MVFVVIEVDVFFVLDDYAGTVGVASGDGGVVVAAAASTRSWLTD